MNEQLGNVALSKLQSTLSAYHAGDEWKDCVCFCLVVSAYKRMLVQCSTLCHDDHFFCVGPPNPHHDALFFIIFKAK